MESPTTEDQASNRKYSVIPFEVHLFLILDKKKVNQHGYRRRTPNFYRCQAP